MKRLGVEAFRRLTMTMTMAMTRALRATLAVGDGDDNGPYLHLPLVPHPFISYN